MTSSEVETDENEAGAPDGGWGWVICLACFFSHVLTDGLFYSFGVVYVELLDYFQEGKGETAVIASLAPSICFITGPIVAVLVNRFGCRAVAISGGMVASVSQFVSIFAPNVQFLYVTLGVLTGTGYGLIYLPSIVAVSQYFEKKRAFATGLGVSGAGIGTFIFSPITSILIQMYTWQGAILIQSGLLLNCVACGLVYRPVRQSISLTRKHGRPREPQDLKTGVADEKCQIVETCDTETCTDSSEIDKLFVQTEICSTNEKEVFLNSSANIEGKSQCGVKSIETLESENIHNCEISKQDLTDGRQRIQSFESIKFKGKCLSPVSKHFDMRIFTSIPFCLFLASTFFYSLGYYVPYIYLPDMAEEAGIDRLSAAWLVSSVGITNTLGRIVFGFLSDRKGVNRLMLYNTALVICGAATAVGPFLTAFWSLLIYTMVFGVFSGVTISLTSVIVADIVGIERLPDAFGVNNLSAGVAAFAGPPLAGWLYYATGDYVVSYACSGVSIALSGAMLYCIPCLNDRCRSRQKSTPEACSIRSGPV